jgi:hypothetical protein
MAFAKWLLDKGACSEARVWQEGKSLDTVWESCERGDWLKWLLSHCNYQWTAAALAEFYRVMAAPLAEYQRVMAPALAEFYRVTAAAWAEYQRVTAAPWDDYQRVTADTIRKLIPYPFEVQP